MCDHHHHHHQQQLQQLHQHCLSTLPIHPLRVSPSPPLFFVRPMLQGWSPLHTAASIGSEDIAGMLLESGATVDAKNSTGCTPLHYAVRALPPPPLPFCRNNNGFSTQTTLPLFNPD